MVRNERFALDSACFEKLHPRGRGAAFPGSWLQVSAGPILLMHISELYLGFLL